MAFGRGAKVSRIVPRILIMVFCACFPGVSSTLYAQKFALLPLADISGGDDGVNLPFTREIEGVLRQKGVDLVPEAEVFQFMVKNRIRFSGYLDSFLARKMGRDLGCDLVLLGTVTEIGEGKDLSLGFTFSAIDTEAGIPVWAGTWASSLGECVRLMGLGQPKALGDLKTPLLDGFLGELTRHLHGYNRGQKRPYQLIGMQLSSDHLQGGKEIDCQLKIRFLGVPPERISVETGWGKTYLSKDQRPNSYRGRFLAPEAEGHYPVSLALEWGKGRPVERITKVASFKVINTPPQLTIGIKKGLRLGEIMAFRDHLIFLPRLTEPRPLIRWSVEIKNSEGNLVIYEESEGNLPPRLVWEGRDARNRKLSNGVYTFGLSVWDAAGNRAKVIKKVAFQSSALPVTITGVKQEGKTYLRVKSVKGSQIPLTAWTLNATSLQGESLLKTEGTGLPALIEVPTVGNEELIRCDLEVKDLLGNRLSLRATDVRVSGEKAFLDPKKRAVSWIEDF